MGVDRSAWLVGPVLFGEPARLLGSEGRWVLMIMIIVIIMSA